MIAAGRDKSTKRLDEPRDFRRQSPRPSLSRAAGIVYSAVSLTGVLFGFLAGAVSFGVLHLAARRLMARHSSRVRLWLPLLYLVRYGLFGLMVYLFLRLGIGDFWGLLVGVVIAIAGSFVWQMVGARHRPNHPE